MDSGHGRCWCWNVVCTAAEGALGGVGRVMLRVRAHRAVPAARRPVPGCTGFRRVIGGAWLYPDMGEGDCGVASDAGKAGIYAY